MSTLLDEDTVVLEQLEFDVPCEWGEHAAQLSISCRACKVQAFMCRDHWESTRLRTEVYLAFVPGARLYCAQCKTKADAVDDLFEVVAL